MISVDEDWTRYLSINHKRSNYEFWPTIINSVKYNPIRNNFTHEVYLRKQSVLDCRHDPKCVMLPVSETWSCPDRRQSTWTSSRSYILELTFSYMSHLPANWKPKTLGGWVVFEFSTRNELRSESRIAPFLFWKRRDLAPLVRKHSMSFGLERISSFSLLDRMLSFKVCLSDPLIGI